MKFSDKLRMARKAKKLTQAALAEQAGLSLRTIIAYEKGETYPQKRSTYQVLAQLLDVSLDYLRNEESEPDLQQPLPKEVWEAKVQQLAHDLGLVPRLTYEEYCEGFRKHAAGHGVILDDNYFQQAQQPTYPMEVTRPAQVADFPALLRIYKQWTAIQKSDDDQPLESIAEKLVHWLDARQCFMMEQDGQPVTWFILECPKAIDYVQNNTTTKPTATMVGPYTVISQQIAISRMFSYCQTCCPNLQIWVEADNAAALAQNREDKVGDRAGAHDAQQVVGGQGGLVGKRAAKTQQQSCHRQDGDGEHKGPAHPLQHAEEFFPHGVLPPNHILGL